MATIKHKTKKQQQEELIQILKFTPVNYTIEIGSSGGEVYYGRVDRKIYDFFRDHKIDIDEYAIDWDDDKANSEKTNKDALLTDANQIMLTQKMKELNNSNIAHSGILCYNLTLKANNEKK
jgi:hypothetical protein